MIYPDSEWISCRDQLPENGEYVLACDYCGKIDKCRFDAESKTFKPQYSGVIERTLDSIRFWVHMPYPPDMRGKNNG